jgi:membrane-associated phospholipid phosphatase
VDSDLYQAINRFSGRTGWLHGIAGAYADYGIGLFAVVLLFAWWKGRASNDLTAVSVAVWTGIACLLSVGLVQPINGTVNRDRPYARYPASVVLVGKTTDPSFPSDHSTVAGALAGGLWLTRRRRVRWVAIGLAALMAATRVYAGVHYPGDVIAGLTIGAAIGLIGGHFLVPLVRRLLQRLQPSPLGRLLTAKPKHS